MDENQGLRGYTWTERDIVAVPFHKVSEKKTPDPFFNRTSVATFAAADDTAFVMLYIALFMGF
jgi:hypothetical protein